MSLRLILLVAIVALNGFFAAAEVALVSVRRSRLKQLAEARQRVGARGAGLAGEPGPAAERDAGRRDAGQPGPGLGGRGHAVSDAARAVPSRDYAAATQGCSTASDSLSHF